MSGRGKRDIIYSTKRKHVYKCSLCRRSLVNPVCVPCSKQIRQVQPLIPIPVFPHDELFRQVIQPEDMEGTLGYDVEKHKQYDKIKDFIAEYKYYTIVNREIPPMFTYGQLRNLMFDVAQQQVQVCRWNMAFGFMLRNKLNDKFKFISPSNNTLLLEESSLVCNCQDLYNLYKHIVSLDLSFVNNYQLDRSASPWRMAGLTNVSVFFYHQGHVTEEPSENLVRMRARIERTPHGYLFTDAWSLWRCVAMGVLRDGVDVFTLERTTKQMYDEFQRKYRVSRTEGCTNVMGMDSLQSIEDHFNIAINIFEVRKDGVVHFLRFSRNLARPELDLNFSEDRFSYIDDISACARVFVCRECQKQFSDLKSSKTHANSCISIVKDSMEHTSGKRNEAEDLNNGKRKAVTTSSSNRSTRSIRNSTESSYGRTNSEDEDRGLLSTRIPQNINKPWFSTEKFEYLRIKEKDVIYLV